MWALHAMVAIALAQYLGNPWTVVGPCTVDPNAPHCIQSSNYGTTTNNGKYRPNEKCTITPSAEARCPWTSAERPRLRYGELPKMRHSLHT